MAEFPSEHPFAPYSDELETHADHLDVLGRVFEDADPDEVQAAMVVLTGESGTDPLPTVSEDADPRNASIWMLGAHIKHVAAVATEASGREMSMEEAADIAIRYVREHHGSEEVYDSN